jgi:endo-1,4-beta-xylanase
VWGISDSESWRADERGLLFTGGNGNYQKKAAYHAVLEELNRGRNPGGPTSPPVSPSDSVTPSTPPSDPVSPSAEPSSPPPPAGCTATVSLNSWNGGFVATIRVTAGSAPVGGWSVTANLPSGAAVTNSWNASASGTSGAVRFGNVAYNGRIAAGQSTEFGFQGTGAAAGMTLACTAS